MSQSLKVLTILAALAASTAAFAQHGEIDAAYGYGSSFSGFRYRPFHVQIEGGATFAQGAAGRDYHTGANIGLGITWQPFAHLPLAVRADGMYEHFHDRPALLSQAAAGLGTAVDWGRTEMWGGDVDAELDTLLGPKVRLYLLAGVGWYDRRDSYFQHGIAEGIFCGWYYCYRGPVLASFKVGEAGTGMKFEQNAGAGLEFALGGNASLFVDARYMRFDRGGGRLDFIPVRIGLRF